MRVLIAEDDEELAGTLAVGLRRENMAVDVALDGTSAAEKVTLTPYDVLVLDRDLPGVRAPSITWQCLQLGLLDAIHIDLAPVVLGRGIRLFDHLTRPVELLITEASGNPHVTHITYQVIK